MRILFFTPSFYPNIGGLEHVAQMMAEGLSKNGLSVTIITSAQLGDYKELETTYDIVRNPSKIQFLKYYLKCDIFFHHNVSLKGLWPFCIYTKKWVILHHLTYYAIDGKLSKFEWIKRKLSKLAHNVSVSNYVNHTLPKKGSVIANPYNENVFYRKEEIQKNKDLLFVGRLVSDKGCLLLLEALYLTQQEGLPRHLTIVGDGPELDPLKEFCINHKINHLVNFEGVKRGEELATIYNQHQILIVPSIWKEPFGIVVLEGLACGCKIIISDGDGLTEASLGEGRLFKKGNVNSLKESILNCAYNTEDLLILPKDLKFHNQNYIAQKWVAYLNKIHEN